MVFPFTILVINLINELIEVSGCENSAENPALSSPNRNFTFLNKDFAPNIAEKALEKIENCGKRTIEFVNTVSIVIVEFPVYCDNRICDNPDCKRHRGYKFTKAHFLQIESLKKQFNKPYAYIFTGWVLPVESINRRWLQNKLLFLYKLLKESSIGGFSVHMEIKLYPVEHKNYGNAYVHFHVVSNFIRDIGIVRGKWKRVVRSEKALTEEKIVKYISKYSSKTPFFATEIDRYRYHNLVYKTQMHRFCIKIDNDISRVKSDFYPLSLLEYEVYCTYRKDSEKNKVHHPFIDDYKNRDRPPDEFIEDSDLIDFQKNDFVDKELSWYKPKYKRPTEKEISDFYE